MSFSSDGKDIRDLIDSLLDAEISAAIFCDKFYSLYILRKKEITLTAREVDVFEKIAAMSSRFSEFEEDHALDHRAFTSEEELLSTVSEQKYW